MRPRKSYEKDAFTTVIESLSTTTSDTESNDEEDNGHDTPFPRDEAHVTILSEIEKRITQFPHKLLAPSATDTALVLYRSPESMGLPQLERQKQEDLKAAMRKRIAEKRRAEVQHVVRNEIVDGYEADAEDWEEMSSRQQHTPAAPANGVPSDHGMNGMNSYMDSGVIEEDEYGDMMDLD